MTTTPETRDRPDRPALSFLSTAYRTEAVVGRMIESVLAQTRVDWELVVVDNGRSDAVAGAVRAYAHDPRIVLVRQENRGMTGGINAAGEAARGRHVAVLNSDDAIAPEFAERLLGVLEADPTLDAVAPDALQVLETSRVPLPERFARGNPRLADPRPVELHELIEGFVPYYTAVVRREAWDRIGGYRWASGAEDLRFWLDLVEQGGRVALVDEPLGVYSIDAGSSSHDAASLERMEVHREEMAAEVARRSGRPEDLAALARTVRASRHRRAVVRARRLLLAGDAHGARAAAQEALAVARDPRTILIAAVVTLAPRPVALAHRARQALRPHLLRLRHVVRARAARWPRRAPR